MSRYNPIVYPMTESYLLRIAGVTAVGDIYHMVSNGIESIPSDVTHIGSPPIAGIGYLGTDSFHEGVTNNRGLLLIALSLIHI